MNLQRPDTVRSQPPLMLFAWQHNLQVTTWLLAAGWTHERIAATFPDVVQFHPGKVPPLLYKPTTRDISMLIPRECVAVMDADDRATWTENDLYSGWVRDFNTSPDPPGTYIDGSAGRREHSSSKSQENHPMLSKITSALVLSALLPFTASAQSTQQAPAPCKVNVQSGTVAELALLPGVGEKTATLIAEAKPATLEALDQVKGIGTVKLSWITPHAVFGSEKTTCTEKQRRPEPAKDGAQ